MWSLCVCVGFSLPPSPSWGAGSVRSVWRRLRVSGCGRGFYVCCNPLQEPPQMRRVLRQGSVRDTVLTITLKKTITALNSHFNRSCFHLEAADEVVSSEELVKDEFECVVTTRLVQSKYIKRPLIHMLRRRNRNSTRMLSELFL